MSSPCTSSKSYYNETIYTKSETIYTPSFNKGPFTDGELWLDEKNVAELLRTNQIAELAARAMYYNGCMRFKNITTLARSLPILYNIE
jgi:hypothetical protein